MIDWLARAEQDRPFLVTDEAVWTYADALEEVSSRVTSEPRVVRPVLEPHSVFDVLAGIAGGGAIVGPPDPFEVGHTPLDGTKLVVFTSGSTGRPKGVRLTKSNLEAAARASTEHLGNGPEDMWLLAMPLSHVGGLSISVRSAFAGGAVRLLPRFDEIPVARLMNGEVTMVSLVPTMLRRLLDREPGPYAGLRAVLVGGGPIPGGLLEEAADAALPVLPTYGMTETFGQIATLRPGAELGYHAHPLPGVDVRIERGRIAIRGGQVSPGYLGEPDRDSDWLLTGDLGEVDDDGALRVLGRADSLIITGGENVDPTRVEAVLLEHPDVTGVVVVGLDDDRWGQVVGCVYAGQVEASSLETWAKQRIPGYMVPKVWKTVTEVPLARLGKPDRSVGRSILEAEPG